MNGRGTSATGALAALAMLPALAACASPAGKAPAKETWVVVQAAADSDVDLGRATATAERGVLAVTVTGPRLVVRVDADRATDLIVSAGGACPLRVPANELRVGGAVERTLAPRFTVSGASSELGFDAVFALSVRVECPGSERGHVEWKQTGGAPLRQFQITEDGYRAGGRTARLEDALGYAPRPGIVALSPRTQGAAELTATWSAPNDTAVTRVVRLAAAARSHGLPNVATGSRLYLGGNGWHVTSAPDGAHAALEMTTNHASFVPDRPGRFELADAEGHALRLVAGRYDDTPLDCGRSDCHAAIATSARSNPMTTIFQRGVDAPFPGDYPACALACHTVGEPGADDGGFQAVLASLGWSASDLVRSGWHALPPAVRRLGGVGCLGCHGPGAIPEPGGRHALLSADVCAYCHDAPPRYGHVAAWSASRMARSDADARTREDPRCASCHTTWGFLGQAERKPPPGSEPLGITCAACHSVHPTHGPLREAGRCEEALARPTDAPPLFAGMTLPEKSRVCVKCHSPAADDGWPSASAAAMWARRGGLDPESGAPLTITEQGAPGDCVACHGLGPPGLGRGAGHAFHAVRSAAAAAPELRETARALLAELGYEPLAGARAGETRHASRPSLDRTTKRGRAAWNLALVLEDPAADVHDGAYARALVDSAKRALGREPRP